MAEQTTNPPSSAVPSGTPGFERKVQLAKAGLLFERLWPRLWGLVALAGLFLLLALTGFWAYVGDAVHKAGLIAFAVGGCRRNRIGGAGSHADARRSHPPNGIAVRPPPPSCHLLRGHAFGPR